MAVSVDVAAGAVGAAAAATSGSSTRAAGGPARPRFVSAANRVDAGPDGESSRPRQRLRASTQPRGCASGTG